MNPSIKKLHEISTKKSRIIIGLMSGTSLDGLDIALCRISGNGMQTVVELENFITIPYETSVRDRLSQISSVPSVPMDRLCYEHTALAHLHAEMIMSALREWERVPSSVDCIASHGQTVYHLPARDHHFPNSLNTTLQIADGDHIASGTGILTISDFRQKHTAHGGEGAPLAGLADRVLFGRDTEDRVLLNIGGIGNFTLLPKKMNSSEIPFTTDTGPGNTLIDKWMQHKFTLPYDKDAAIALSGNIHPELIHALLQDRWFDGDQSKTTGPEYFSLEWFYRKSRQAGMEPDQLPAEDVAASLTELSALTMSEAVSGQLTDDLRPVVYVSGGGMHNPFLLQRLKVHLSGIEIKSVSDLNVNPDAKEAVIFAVLANEMLAGEGLRFQDKSGAVKTLNLGKISFPG